MHEEEPKSPLESSVREDVPVPNSDNIPFVSLNDVGNHAGDFHPSGSVGRNIVARSMDLGDDSEEVTTDQTVTEADHVHEVTTEPNVEEKDLDIDFARLAKQIVLPDSGGLEAAAAKLGAERAAVAKKEKEEAAGSIPALANNSSVDTPQEVIEQQKALEEDDDEDEDGLC